MYWVEFKDKCHHKAFDVHRGYICKDPCNPEGSKGCIEKYCPVCAPSSENVRFPLELLGIEIKMTNKRFVRMFELKARKCKHRETGNSIVSPDECLCTKGQAESFCSIYSCPYVNKEEE